MSFSTSRALIDWVKRYVSNQRNENPDDERFKSVSSFIHHNLEFLMETFERGKTLDDFDRFIDEPVKDFYDDITFRAIIPIMEENIALNKFNPPSKGLTRFLTIFRKFIIKDVDFDEFIENLGWNIRIITKRVENFIQQNNISDTITIEKDKNFYILEFTGKYKNLHFEFCKTIASILGVCGMKIKNVSYLSEEPLNHFYVRFDCVVTSLLKEKYPGMRQQLSLAGENISRFLESVDIIDERSEHLWLESMKSNDTIISFKDPQAGIRKINYILNKGNNNETDVDLTARVLKIFEHFRWIHIDNETTLDFQFLIEKTTHPVEHQIMEHVLARCSITHEDLNQ